MLHQDFPYWGGLTEAASRVATAMLFLDDASLENRCLEVVPGSHREGLQVRRAIEGLGGLEIDPANYDEHADKLAGVHMNMPIDLNLAGAKFPGPPEYGTDEQVGTNRPCVFSSTAADTLRFRAPDRRPWPMHSTTPAGVCAWILKKRRAWSDCGGNVEKRFTKDELLTAMTLYWATESYGTSTRF